MPYARQSGRERVSRSTLAPNPRRKVLVRLHQSLVDREELVRKLANLGIVYHGVINALRRKLNVNSSLVHAGLHQFADICMGPSNFRKPLAELDQSLKNPIITKTPAGK